MHLITVSPLAKSPLKENLSYFHREALRIGDLVTIAVKGKHLPGLVMDSHEVQDVKSVIKAAAYPIKKIISVRAGKMFTPQMLKAGEMLSDYYGVPVGTIVRHFISQDLLTQWEGSSVPDEAGYENSSNTVLEEYVLQAPLAERTSLYRAMIREEFAKKKSILILAPSRPLAEAVAPSISKGIEEYLHVIHGDLSKKELLSLWKKISDTDHPLAIVATPSLLAIPRRDFGAIVCEHEHSSAYKLMYRPHVDARKAARFLAQAHGAKYIAADTLLRTGSMHKKDEGKAYAFAPIKHRQVATSDFHLVDMKVAHRTGNEIVISPELAATIKNAVAHRQNIFLLTVRKGLAPLTVCADCGINVTCPQCERPLALFGNPTSADGKPQKNSYHCLSCRQNYSSEIKCAVCKSWRLVPLGIGTEKIAEIMHLVAPGVPLFALDGTSVKNHKEGFDIARRFYETPGSILIGTEMALAYLDSIPVSAAVSIDTLFAIPDFRMNERIMHLLVGLREKTGVSMIVQTRKIDEAVFEHAKRGTLQDFYRDEVALRKRFKYPPTSFFIKIHFEGTTAELEKGEAYIEHILGKWKPEFFTGFETPAAGKESLNALIRLDPHMWPDKELRVHLSSLPNVFDIDIDPESII